MVAPVVLDGPINGDWFEVCFGRGSAILAEREEIKKLTIQNRRLIHHR
jgi:hypothetical protein